MKGVCFVLPLCQGGKFLRGEELKMLYKTNIGLAELMSCENLKSRHTFFIFNLKCYFRSSDIQVFRSFTKQCKGLESNNVEYSEVT